MANSGSAYKKGPAPGDAADCSTSAEQQRLKSAVERASGYQADQQGDAGLAPGSDAVRPMEEWRDVVSQRIEDAMRLGLFDNLPGAGKPLDLHRNPFVPEDQQMAITLLRNNNLAPAWISERKAILTAIDDMRSELRMAADRMQTSLGSATESEQFSALHVGWARWLDGWQMRMDKLNDRILVHNLRQPVRHLEITMLLLTDELTRAGARLEWSRPPT